MLSLGRCLNNVELQFVDTNDLSVFVHQLIHAGIVIILQLL